MDLGGAALAVLSQHRLPLVRLFTLYGWKDATPPLWGDMDQPRGSLASGGFVAMMCDLDVCPDLLGHGSLSRVRDIRPFCVSLIGYRWPMA